MLFKGRIWIARADAPLSLPLNPSDTVSGLGKVSAVALGGRHKCAIIESGKVKCWGDNRFGQLGAGLEALDSKTPVEVKNITDAVGIEAGVRHTCVIHKNKEVSCWGDNQSGQTGHDTYYKPAARKLNLPAKVKHVDNVDELAVGRKR